MSRIARSGLSKTYATCLQRQNLVFFKNRTPRVDGWQYQAFKQAACAGHPQVSGGRQRGGRTYPVSLAFKKRRGLVKHLLQSLFLGDALGEGRSVGVYLV